MSVLNRELPYVNAYGTVDISGAKDVVDALCKAGMDWEVVSKKMYDENGNEFEGYRANVRDTDNHLLGVVSDSYKIVQNSSAFEFVDNLVDEGFEFKSAGQFRDGKSIWIMGDLPKENILGDGVDNNVIFINSHDGSSGVKILMTPVRIICSNMLNMATREAQRSWSARHTKRVEYRIDEARHTLKLANKYIKSLKEEADVLSCKKIADSQIEAILDKMFPVDLNNDTERKIKNVEVFKTNFFNCYDEADIKQFKGTAWGAINAMSDLISHKTPDRITDAYYNNHWKKLVNGHPVFDDFTKRVKSV